MRASHDAGELLTHPAILAALGTWALNDHLLKVRWPGWLSGKLSDVACLIVIPILVGGGVELWRELRGRPARATGWLRAAALVSAVVMVAINTWTPAAAAYERGFAFLQWPLRAIGSLLAGSTETDLRPVILTMDPTDLLTVPAAAVPVWLDRRRLRGVPVNGRPTDQARIAVDV